MNLQHMLPGLHDGAHRASKFFSTACQHAVSLLLFASGAGDDKFTFPLWKKIVAGGFSGCIGAAIANPTGEGHSQDLRSASEVGWEIQALVFRTIRMTALHTALVQHTPPAQHALSKAVHVPSLLAAACSHRLLPPLLSDASNPCCGRSVKG
jgi:hypothetical protein